MTSHFPGPHDPELRAYERRWLILAALCFSLLVIVLDNTILNVAIPTIVKSLNASNSQLQWMVDSYTLVFAGLLLTAGSLGDRYGRRGALQVGLVIFGLGSAASALAGSADQLIATRALMGIGGAFIMPATLSIITNVFPAGERGKAIGVWAGTAGLGVALGPLAGGFLLEHFYWGSIFLVNVPIVIIGLIAGWVLIPTSKDPASTKLDWIGALLSMAGLTALLYGIIEAPGKGWTAPAILSSFGLAIVLFIVFIVWERHSTHPMLDVRFFKNPRFTAASTGITCVFFALFGATFVLTQYLQFTLGYDPLQAGVRLLPFAVVLLIVAPSSAKIVERFGTKLVVGCGLLIAAAGLASMVTLETTTSYWEIAWRLALIGLGQGLVMAPATESIMGSLPLAKAGVGSAVNDTTRQVGGALGVAVIGSVMSSTYGTKINEFFASKSTLVPKNLEPTFARAHDVSHSSLGGADAVAKSLSSGKVPGVPETIGHTLGAQLHDVANQAFVSGLHTGVLVAAGVAVLGAVVAFIWLPAREHEPTGPKAAGIETGGA